VDLPIDEGLKGTFCRSSHGARVGWRGLAPKTALGGHGGSDLFEDLGERFVIEQG
jgi:hypothetical protein